MAEKGNNQGLFCPKKSFQESFIKRLLVEVVRLEFFTLTVIFNRKTEVFSGN
jgi:hypothetical protein